MSDRGRYRYNIQDSYDDQDKSPEKLFPMKTNGTGSHDYSHGEVQEMMIMNGTNELDMPGERQSLIMVLEREPGEGEMNIPVEKEPEPHDRFMLVYIIMLIHGIGVLMPWNMFITANSYFVDYKLNTNSSTDQDYRANFLSYLGICAQLPTVILNAVNLFGQCGKGGNTTARVIGSIIMITACFIVTVILAIVDSSEWPGTFFVVTMVTVVIINSANGIYQNSIFGLAASLPMKYTNAVVLGSNISGTLASVISILSVASTPDPRTSAIYYFVAAVFVLLVAFDTYFVLPLLPFFKYHKKKHLASHHSSDDNLALGPPMSKLNTYIIVVKQCWKQLLGVYLIFFVTLCCFPAMMANVEKSDENFLIPEKFYSGILCFLFFNAFAMFGNLATEFVRVPGPKWVLLPVVLRIVFIPFFMLCNYWPGSERRFPVYIASDYVYMFGGIIMSFTSGYFSSLCMMYAPNSVKDPRLAPTAGMMGAFFLVLGVFSGVSFSRLVSLIVSK